MRRLSAALLVAALALRVCDFLTLPNPHPRARSLRPSGLPAAGRIVLVEGRRVHIYCTGAGEPTVLLEEGRGGASLNWAWVQRGVTKASRVCSYDRRGYGWSDPADRQCHGHLFREVA
jgi:hypothetical protein